MQDARTLSYLNMYAILGSLVQLCQLNKRAGELVKDAHVSIGFAVKDGPQATLSFREGKVTLLEGVEKCTIRLPFSSPEKFNGMIDGVVTPIPTKGITKVGFLLHTFKELTDILTEYLRPSEEKLQDEVFFRTSTTLMLHVIASAVAQVGNQDKIGRASASYISDGDICLSIGEGAEELGVGLRAKDHVLTPLHEKPQQFTSYMHFADLKTARALFDGKVNAVVCVGEGLVRVGGMISQIDNVNRILDRVSLYLA